MRQGNRVRMANACTRLRLVTRSVTLGQYVQAAIGRIMPLTTAPIMWQLAEVAREETIRG
jgi:hypothetical protein